MIMGNKKIHMVGIGGIGMSALAQLYAHEGAIVSGSDRSSQPTTELLQQKSIPIFIGQAESNVPLDADLLVYSDAILEGSDGYTERTRARALGIPEQSYFEALGDVANTKKVIAVAGAHGKTTTTAMLTDIFEEANLDPTAVVGSLRAKTKSNFRAGAGEYFIVEADEYRRHFLNFSPYILVITNIDADHLDYYKDLTDIQSAFRVLAQKIPPNGFVVCDAHNENIKPVIANLACTIIDYKEYVDSALPLKVLHFNRINAAAALAVASIVNIPLDVAKKTLADFTGTWRRFEYRGKTKSGALLYDDYGHHPVEISTTLASVREQFPGKRIVVAFHPHLYSRTKALLDDFSKAFLNADEVLIAPIFAAREAVDPTISSEILAARIREQGIDATALASLAAVGDSLAEHTHAGDLIITMGAGDIYTIGEQLLAA
jgi:UDP-N-acetylmuramate--alanine ligase